MSPRRKVAKSGTTKAHDATKAWSSLTWDDLDKWAGGRSVSRGEAYQRQGRVRNLSLADDGRLLATVDGGQRYETSAWLVPGKGKRKQLESVCTCPVGASGCKHAVAVVADFLAAMADQRQVPAAAMADVFEALAAPARRAILDVLHERDGQTLFEICARLTMKHNLTLTRQAISQHLDVLEVVGLVSTKREGRYKFHYLDTTPLNVINNRWLKPTRKEGEE